jgi:hypothetical protein
LAAPAHPLTGRFTTRCLGVDGLTSYAGLTVTEFNPAHGAEDGSTDALVRGLVGALAG